MKHSIPLSKETIKAYEHAVYSFMKQYGWHRIIFRGNSVFKTLGGFEEITISGPDNHLVVVVSAKRNMTKDFEEVFGQDLNLVILLLQEMADRKSEMDEAFNNY